MKKLYNCSIIFFLHILFIQAQAPSILWQNRLGGSGSDGPAFGIIASDGGFMLGTRSDSNISFDKSENSRGGFDYWIIKTDENGNKLWDKTIGGGVNSVAGNGHDIFSTLNQTPDGGYILCGFSHSPVSGEKTENAIDDSDDIWVLKIDALGNIKWQNTIGGDYYDLITRITLTNDGGYLLCGNSISPVSGDKTEPCRGTDNLSDCWFVKLNSIGEVQWDKTIGGLGSDAPVIAFQNPDNSFTVFCQSNSNISFEKTENSRGSTDCWILRLDQNGVLLWQKTIGGSGYDGMKALQTNDGGYLIIGVSNSPISGEKTAPNKGLEDYWVLKTDENLNIQWQQTYGGDDYDTLSSVFQCTDSSYILSGGSLSGISGDKIEASRGSYDSWIIKINETGEILWQKTIGGSGSDGLSTVYQTLDGGYFLSGGTNSPISDDVTMSPKGSYDCWIMKLAPENLSTNQNQQLNSIWIKNPIKNSLEINTNYAIENASIKVTDMLGKELFSTFNVLINGSLEIPVSLSNGVYFVTIANEKNSVTKKIVKQ